MLRLAALAPYLVALLPLVRLAVRNSAACSPVAIAALAALIVVAVALLNLLLRRLLPAPGARRLWLALVLLVPSLYPFWRTFAVNLEPPLTPPVIAALFLLLTGMVAAIAAWRWRRSPPGSEPAAIFGFVALLLVVFQGWTLGQDTLRRQADFSAHCAQLTALSAAEVQAAAVAVRAPDILHIVVDGYARADTLRRVCGYDNRPFLDALRQRGFTINDHAIANYPQTLLALGSALNLTYIPALPPRYDNWPHYYLLQHSRVIRLLEARGYVVRDASGGYAGIAPGPRHRLPDAVFPQHADLLVVLLGVTPLPDMLDGLLRPRSLAGLLLRRAQEIAWQRAAEPPEEARPTYTFFHCVSAHGPLLHDVHSDWPEDISQEARIPLYVGAVAYTGNRLLQLIDRVQARRERPTRILIHSDHGSDLCYDWERPERSDLPERFGILLADNGDTDPPRSPVNLFRRLLTREFNLDYPLLPDRAFLSGASPHLPIDITDSLPL